MINETASPSNGMDGQVPVGMQAYENDYLFDLLGYRVIEQAVSPAQVQRINDWVDAQPPCQPGDWVGNVHVHTYQGHDGTNYQNIVEGGDVFEDRGAVQTLEAGLDSALAYLDFPSSHHRLIGSTNGLERLFEEIKRRTRVVRIFPSETSACNLSTAVALRASEDWALRRYLEMEPYRAWKELKQRAAAKPTQIQT